METYAPGRAGLLLITAEPFNAESPLKTLQAPITTIEHHYVRSHFPVPQHTGALAVDGAVDRPLRVTLGDLRALPSATLSVTLECAGNGRQGLRPIPKGEAWGWTAVGTAVWTGVPLQAVLARAGIRPEGSVVLFEGADHGSFQGSPDTRYIRSLALPEVERLGEDILLAYAMNGEPLTPDHGAPIRLIVPGWYGMASVKWLQRIRVAAGPYSGEFQTHSYVYHWPDGSAEPVTTMRVRALITSPVAGAVLMRGMRVIRGKAWSGNGPVTAVEVKVDGGERWQPALLAPSGSSHAWQEWTFDWNVTQIGRHVLSARAHDSTGAVQPDLPVWNRDGYGNNAIEPLIVDVR